MSTTIWKKRTNLNQTPRAPCTPWVAQCDFYSQKSPKLNSSPQSPCPKPKIHHKNNNKRNPAIRAIREYALAPGLITRRSISWCPNHMPLITSVSWVDLDNLLDVLVACQCRVFPTSPGLSFWHRGSVVSMLGEKVDGAFGSLSKGL